LEVTLKCDDDYRDSSGKLVHLYNVTRVKASHPFFNCANGCIPVSYSQGGQVSYVELAEDRKTPEAIAIRFPNNVLLQGTHTLLSRDGTKIVDEVSWPPLVSHSIAWEVGSTKKIETYGCTDCFNAYPDRTRIELTKVS
jgi:hypothetical protein